MKRHSNTGQSNDSPSLPSQRIPRSMDGALSPEQARSNQRLATITLPREISARSKPSTTPPRDISQKHKPSSNNFKRAQRLPSFQVMGLLIGSIIILLAGGWVFATTLATNKQARQQITQLAQASSSTTSTSGTSSTTTSNDIPDEAQIVPKVYGAYVVAPDLPRYLRIPKFGVKARVVRLGVLNNGELATPRSIWDVGWYDGSSKPSEAGAALLAGHYSGPTQPGAFAKISGLVAGDAFAIEKGDGSVINYQVVKTVTLPNNQVSMANALVSITPGKKGLNFITCAGSYSPRTNNYSERTVVYSVQL